ncbi:MAG: hypothetical protein WBD62_09500, partial [Anaerolineales bacterium]
EFSKKFGFGFDGLSWRWVLLTSKADPQGAVLQRVWCQIFLVFVSCHHVLFCSPTVCVIGGGAGWDSAWEQEKPEIRKCLKMRQNPHRPLHALLARCLSLITDF